MFTVRWQHRHHHATEIKQDEINCCLFSKNLLVIHLDKCSEEIQHIHINEEMNPVSMYQSAADKTIPLPVGVDEIRIENQPAFHIFRLKSEK